MTWVCQKICPLGEYYEKSKLVQHSWLSIEHIGSYYDVTFFNYFNFTYFARSGVFQLNLLNNWMLYPQKKRA